MKEAVILQSPHAIDPLKNLTEAEKIERYRTRLDETFRPYTVVDVLTSVYHRCFEDDLRNYIGENPDEFVSLEDGWCVSRAWVNECRVGRVETLFFQPLSDFQVELYVHAALRVEIVRNGNALLKRIKSIRTDLRLQYSFDLRPCKLTCRFTKAIVNEEDSLIARYPNAIRADKYLLPVLQEADYAYLAKCFMAQHGISAQDVPLNAEAIVKHLGLKLLKGVFPENGVMGEIYFNYGHAMIIDPDTGEVRDADINPGTIILNFAASNSIGLYNVTLLHECAHHLLAIKHFLLQMTHGHQFCSYSGKSCFASRIVCGDCGAFYGSKVWHSTDEYRRTIWRCNNKYEGDKKCSTPHVTQDELEKAFVSVMQEVIAEKDVIFAVCREVLDEVLDTTELDRAATRLQDQALGMAERVRKLVEENARVRRDQAEYQREYDALVAEHEKLSEKIRAVEAQKNDKADRRRQIEVFLHMLEAQEECITFDPYTFVALIDKVVVDEMGMLEFCFRNGMKYEYMFVE